jgi:hypothetical protein
MRDWLVVGVCAALQRYFTNRNRRAKMDMTLDNILIFFSGKRRGPERMFSDGLRLTIESPVGGECYVSFLGNRTAVSGKTDFVSSRTVEREIRRPGSADISQEDEALARQVFDWIDDPPSRRPALASERPIDQVLECGFFPERFQNFVDLAYLRVESLLNGFLNVA